MKFKLTYLALAVLVMAVCITVWVEIQVSRESRQRQAVQAKVDAVVAKLNVRLEIIYCDVEVRERLHRVRSWSYQLRQSRNPTHWRDLDKELPQEIEPDSEERTGDDQPAATQPDEFQTFGLDDGSADVQAASEACATVQGWYDNAGDENGEYLRRHPEMGATRLTPLLTRLLNAEDDALREAACRALFAMGDRSPRLRGELEEFYRQAQNPKGGGGLFGSSPGPPASGPAPLSWEDMLAQFGGWTASTQASQKAEGDVPEFSSESAPADPLFPPGVMYALGDGRFHHGREIESVEFSPDGKSLMTGGGGLLCVWNVSDGALRSHLLACGRPKDSCRLGACFLPDGRVLILSGAADKGKFLVWAGEQGAAAPVKTAEDYEWFTVAPDGKTVAAVVMKQPAVQLFELPSLKPVHRVTLPGGGDRSKDDSWPRDLDVVFSADGKKLVCYDHRPGQTRRVIVFDAGSGRQTQEWRLKVGIPGGIAADQQPGDNGVAIDGQNRLILMSLFGAAMVDLASGKEQRVMQGDYATGGWTDGKMITIPNRNTGGTANGGQTVFDATSGEVLRMSRTEKNPASAAFRLRAICWPGRTTAGCVSGTGRRVRRRTPIRRRTRPSQSSMPTTARSMRTRERRRWPAAAGDRCL